MARRPHPAHWVFMRRHLPWYRRLPQFQNNTIMQIYILRGRADWNALTPAQKATYKGKFGWMTVDAINPPPGVAPVVGLLPIGAPPVPVGPVGPVAPIIPPVPPVVEGDEPGYNGFTPGIQEPASWAGIPVKLSTKFVQSLDRPVYPDPDPALGTWKMVKVLGAGGFGVAFLWVRLDENNVVQQRLVAKDATLYNLWDIPQTWLPNKIHQIPMEVGMHRRAGIAVSGDPGSDFVAQCKGFQLHQGLRMYRLATEYAECGTLLDFLRLFRPKEYDALEIQHKADHTAAEAQLAWMNLRHLLRLRFAINLFIALIKGVQHLNRKGIVHRDLGKADNILLAKVTVEDEDEEMDEKGYLHELGLRPLITDFGLAMPVQSTFDNPGDLMENPGAIWTLSPEQTFTYPPISTDQQNEKTNTYQLGSLMAEVVCYGTFGDCFLERDRGIGNWTWRPPWKTQNTAADRHIDDQPIIDSWFRIDVLKRQFASIMPSIKSCLRFRQEDRPDLDDLRRELENILEDLDDSRIRTLSGKPYLQDLVERDYHDIFKLKTQLDEKGEPITAKDVTKKDKAVEGSEDGELREDSPEHVAQQLAENRDIDSEEDEDEDEE